MWNYRAKVESSREFIDSHPLPMYNRIINFNIFFVVNVRNPQEKVPTVISRNCCPHAQEKTKDFSRRKNFATGTTTLNYHVMKPASLHQSQLPRARKIANLLVSGVHKLCLHYR